MTSEECKQQLSAVCAAIVDQNRELMDEMDDPDFDPAIRLDNTKNNAAYMLTDFFDVLKCFPHGGVPHEATDELVVTTDELLAKIRAKYGDAPNVLEETVRAGQAFRKSKRIWRIRNPISPLSPEEYGAKLDAALCDILRALDDLNCELNLLALQPHAKEESAKCVQVVQLATQAKAIKKQSDLSEKLDSLMRDSRRNGEMIRETLWHASGKLPQYKPTDGRSVNVVKEAMVQLAVERILSGKGASPRAILNAIIDQYAEIPGGYDSITPFLRQVERVMKKSEHNLKDMF